MPVRPRRQPVSHGMATVKLTMALPEEQLEELHRLVAGGQT
jgi:hypothetical protein